MSPQRTETRRLRNGRRARPSRDTRLRPMLESLEVRSVPTTFTLTSPTALGLLPTGVTPVGGLVLDMVGINGRRVVSQIAASQLFNGFFDSGSPAAYRGNPGTIGIQDGLSGAVLDALGGGLADLAVRITLFDGDTSLNDFDYQENLLLINGVTLGDFSNVATEQTTSDGQTTISFNAAGGFRDERLDTGFFHTTNPAFLAAFYQTLVADGRAVFQLKDPDPYDNYMDFTRGVDGSLTDVGKPPAVINLPPVITGVATNSPVAQGDTANVTVAASDPDGAGQVLTYSFDFDADGVDDVTNTTGVASFLYSATGRHEVRIRVADSTGDSATTTTAIVVANNAPRVEPPADQSASEGTSGTFDLGTLFDQPGANPWAITVDWGDGSPVESFQTGTTGPLGGRAHRFDQDGAYHVTVTADDGSARGSASFQVNVANVAPVVIAPANQASSEGAATTFNLGSFTDPGTLDSWNVTVNWGDGSPIEAFTATPGNLGSRAHVYAQDGVYHVTVAVADDRAVTASAFDVNVANVAPVVSAPANQASNEGAATSFNLGSFADPGILDGWNVTVDWGDGSPIEAFTATPGNLGSRAHVYAQDGVYHVSVAVADDHTVTASSFDVNVANVAPVVNAPANQASNEGAVATLDLGAFSDPGILDSWNVTINWGDGSPTETFTATPGALGTLRHLYAQDGNYDASVTVRDDDTATTAGFQVAVANVAPVVLPAANARALEGAATSFVLGSFLDPGVLDGWNVTVDWGDGSPVESFSATPGFLGSRVHAYAQDGAYSVTVTVADDHAATASTFNVDVANVAPNVSAPANQASSEGAATSFNLGSFSDPGTLDSWDVTVDWGDGSPVETFSAAPGNLGSRIHVYAQDGVYHVTVTTADDHNATASHFNVNVANVAPIVNAPADQASNEGTATSFNLGSFTDPGILDSWNATVDWGDGSPIEAFSTTTGALGSRTHAYAQDGVYHVTVIIADEDSASTASFSVNVANVAPIVTAPGDQAGTEGTANGFDLGSFSDPGVLDGWDVTVDWGDGSPIESFSATPGNLGSRAHVYAQDGVYHVTVTTADDHNATASSFSVNVANVAPVVTAPSNQASNEGTAASFNLGSFSDPGILDSWYVTVDWGDGSPIESFSATPGNLGSRIHVYAQDGVYQVTVTTADDHNATASSFDVNVANVAPIVTAPANQSSNEGAAASFNLGSFTDPGILDSWDVSVDWGDGSPVESLSATPGSLGSRAHVYAQDGVYHVTVTTADDHNATASSFDVNVANIAPIVSAPANQASYEGTASSFNLGSFSDPGTLDSWDVTVDWGDGSPVENFTATPGSLGSLPHLYAQDGVYHVTVTTADDHSATASSFNVNVANVAPIVSAPANQSSYEGTASSFNLGSFTDPGVRDTWNVTVDWGDGSPIESFSATPGNLGSHPHLYAQDGVYHVTVTTADDHTATASSFNVNVANVAPIVSAPAGQYAEEGSEGRFNLGAFTDPGVRDTWNVTINWGDGSPIETFSATPGSLGSLPHLYEQDGVYHVSVTIADDHDARSATFPVLVANIGPTLATPADQKADEGSDALFNLGSFADPGTLDSWDVTVDWGDGSPVETFSATPGDLGSRVHVYAQDGVYHVTVTTADDHNATASSFDVNVANVAPRLEGLTVPETVTAGGLVAVSGRVDDPGIGDQFTLVIDWGQGRTTTVPLAPKAHTFQLNVTAPADLGAGAHPVTVTIRDDAGGSFTDAASVTVGATTTPTDPTTVFLMPSLGGAATAGSTGDENATPSSAFPAAIEQALGIRMALPTMTTLTLVSANATPEPEAETETETEAKTETKKAPAAVAVAAPPAPAPALVETQVIAAPAPAPAAAPAATVALASTEAVAETQTNTSTGAEPVTIVSKAGALQTTVMVLAVLQQRSMRSRRGKLTRFTSKMRKLS